MITLTILRVHSDAFKFVFIWILYNSIHFFFVEFCGGFGPSSEQTKTYMPCSRLVNEPCEQMWEQEEEVACKTWYTWAPDCKTET